MRYEGRITTWKDERGFGFITPNSGGEDVFVHARAFASRLRRPVGDETVTYQLQVDDAGRLRARHVAFVGAVRGPPGHSGWRQVAPCFAAAFLGFVLFAAVAGRLPLALLYLVVVASVATFLVYLQDKSAARDHRWRIPERTLHLLALAGGWPGALAGQRLARHKSSKASFQRVYWITVAANCGAIGASYGGGDLPVAIWRALPL